LALILSIDTATEVCSVTLANDGSVLTSLRADQSNQHIEQLTLLIDQVMTNADKSMAQVQAVAVSMGPGSYTSLRVGISVAKGICFALGIPLIGIGTLDALASASLILSKKTQNHAKRYIAIPLLDARREEVCLAAFDENCEKIYEIFNCVVSNKMFDVLGHLSTQSNNEVTFILSGNGAKKLESCAFLQNLEWSAVTECLSEYLVPLAEQKFQISDFQSVAYFEPIYFKPPSVTTSKKIVF
jgi:tRNA threonylcarbamoyladenosine biosynthesis protein TsaB